MTRLLTFFSLLCIFLSPTSWSAERYDRARALLEKMSQSIHELNYRGLFTYEVGGALDNYKIIHQVRDNIEYEKLQKLNGGEKEILRSGFPQDCLSRGDRFFRGIDLQAAAELDEESRYFYHLTGKGRVAGRDTLTVQILPKDAHRYGYVFSIDKKTKLPLQILMIGEAKKILERVQYVELEVGLSFDETELLPRSAKHASVENEVNGCPRDTEGERNSLLSAQAENQMPWQLMWIPPGYSFLGKYKTQGGDLMMSYTDGLSSFSVVVGVNRLFPSVEGRAQMGGTVAYVRQGKWENESFTITVIGEIPMSTAYKIAERIEKRE